MAARRGCALHCTDHDRYTCYDSTTYLLTNYHGNAYNDCTHLECHGRGSYTDLLWLHVLTMAARAWAEAALRGTVRVVLCGGVWY